MRSTTTNPERASRRAILSTLWIFVLFNYVYADVAMMNFNPGFYARVAAAMSPGFVLLATVLVEIPIAMIFLSRVLPYRSNRWANILAGGESTAFVGLTLIGGTMPAFYVFIALIEIASTVFIIWYAWRWSAPRPEGTRPGAQPG